MGSSIASTMFHVALVTRLSDFKLVGGMKGIGGGVDRCAGDDRGDGWVHLRSVFPDEWGEGGIAFGDPRALVEQLRRVEKGLQVDLDALAAESDECIDGRRVEQGIMRIAEELELACGGHAEAEASGSM